MQLDSGGLLAAPAAPRARRQYKRPCALCQAPTQARHLRDVEFHPHRVDKTKPRPRRLGWDGRAIVLFRIIGGIPTAPRTAARLDLGQLEMLAGVCTLPQERNRATLHLSGGLAQLCAELGELSIRFSRSTDSS